MLWPRRSCFEGRRSALEPEMRVVLGLEERHDLRSRGTRAPKPLTAPTARGEAFVTKEAAYLAALRPSIAASASECLGGSQVALAVRRRLNVKSSLAFRLPAL